MRSKIKVLGCHSKNMRSELPYVEKCPEVYNNHPRNVAIFGIYQLN
jgi:hypothetical protein